MPQSHPPSPPTWPTRIRAKAIDWLANHFGFTSLAVFDDGAGTVYHAELKIGERGLIMINGANPTLRVSDPQALGSASAGTFVRVDSDAEVDRIHANAVAGERDPARSGDQAARVVRVHLPGPAGPRLDLRDVQDQPVLTGPERPTAAVAPSGGPRPPSSSTHLRGSRKLPTSASANEMTLYQRVPTIDFWNEIWLASKPYRSTT